MSTRVWSKSHHGVSHLFLYSSDRGVRQITLEDHGSFINVYVLGMTSFTPIAEQNFDVQMNILYKGEHPDLLKAKAWGEEQAEKFGV